MSAHLVLFDQHKANANGRFAIVDPGNAGTIGGAHGVDRSPAYCDLVSTGAETRTLGAPTAAGDFITINGKTVGGTITVTVTNGYNQAGDTTFTITAAKQWYEFVAVWDGTTYFWRLAGSYTASNSGLTLSAPSTPAAVATSPGTAQAAELTATGGVGGNSTIATTGVGGVGGGFALTGGAGGVATAGATASTGGAGGALAVTLGAGGAEAVAAVTSTGGAGGAFTVTTGAGGAVSAAVSGTATGGASGGFTFATGAGGAVTATTGTNVGGASGAVSILTGVGGAASGGSGNTGGASGALTLGTGTGGAGTTGGASGDFTLQTGAAGAGGSPATGNLILKTAATERFRVTGSGVLTNGAATPSNVTAAGSIIAAAFTTTDVTNASFTQASHGSGTVSYFIGNASINTTSDARLKENVADVAGDPLALIAQAPRLVSFTWNDPQDRHGPENLHGKNSRGTYLGWLAQETIGAYPWVVNAGAGKDCPKCSAGEPCGDPDHGNWTVEYQHLVPLLMAGLNRLVGLVKSQGEEIANLRARL